jgi:hypothetical protein
MEQGDRTLEDLNKKTVVELKNQAKNMGLSGYSKLKKAELIDLIQKNRRSRSPPRPSSPRPSPPRSSPPRPSPKRPSSSKKKTVVKDEEWSGLGQMSVLPVEIIDKIYKELPTPDKSQFIQTNKLLKKLMGGKVPEKEKKKYVERKQANKNLFEKLLQITNQDADRYHVPYEDTVPHMGEISWDEPLDVDYGTVIVPKKIVNLIEVEQNLKNGVIVPSKGKLDTVGKLITYVNGKEFGKINAWRLAKSNFKMTDKTNLYYANLLLTQDIKEKLIEYYLNLIERIEERLSK